jgi:hypothetical protein
MPIYSCFTAVVQLVYRLLACRRSMLMVKSRLKMEVAMPIMKPVCGPGRESGVNQV